VTDAITDVPVEANKTHASGNCNGTTQTIVLHFFDSWQLALSFGLNESDGEYHMTHASLKYSFGPGHLPFTDAAQYANKSGVFRSADILVIAVLKILMRLLRAYF